MPKQPARDWGQYWSRGMAIVAALAAAAPALAQTAPPETGGPVPVQIAQARRQDIAEFTTGIGTVQAYRTVLIRARVDGTLEKIAFTEGQTVHPGDLLAEIDPRPYQAVLDQARAKRAADAAQMQNARLDMARYAALARTNFASRQQVDTQGALLAQDAANIEGDEASIATAALNLSFCRITAPIEGVVGLRQVDIGNLVHANDTGGIVTLTQIHPISLVFTLPQDELPRVRDAMAQGPARVIATVSGTGKPMAEGTLLTTNNTIDAQTGTIQLKAIFENRDDHLWPGQFTAARLQLGVLRQALTVPPAAVQHGPDGVYVYIAKPDDTVARQDIALGYQSESASVVISGLHDGDRVVVAGQSRLQAGVKIVVKPAA